MLGNRFHDHYKWSKLSNALLDSFRADSYTDNLYLNSGPNNITRTGTFTSVPYSFAKNASTALEAIVDQYSGVGKI
jgi:hypothetical protein